jgi:hypothetical protein
MLLALVDRFRCTEPHADTWLVARADVADGGWMRDGVLGCPTCASERAVRGGVVRWRDDLPMAEAPAADAEEAAMRAAALLGLAEGQVPYAIAGPAGVLATQLADAPLVLLDPPDDALAGLVTIVRGAPWAPFAAGALRGLLFSGPRVSAEAVARSVPALVTGGRVVAPAAVAVPAGVRELARDAEEWVGEWTGAAVTVPLARARRPG